MPICFTCNEDMTRCQTSAEVHGKGFNRRQAHTEDFVCPTCGYRIRLYYLIVNIGGAENKKRKL